jgi:hypothetical protein
VGSFSTVIDIRSICRLTPPPESISMSSSVSLRLRGAAAVAGATVDLDACITASASNLHKRLISQILHMQIVTHARSITIMQNE